MRVAGAVIWRSLVRSILWGSSLFLFLGVPSGAGDAIPGESLRLTPAAVWFEPAGESPVADPWSLFDGSTAPVALPATPAKLAVQLAQSQRLERLRLFGGADVTLYTDSGAGWQRCELLTDGSGSSTGWQNFIPARPVETTRLMLDLVPRTASTVPLAEVEIWGDAATTVRDGDAALTLSPDAERLNLLLARRLPQLLEIPLTQATGAAGDTVVATFTLEQHPAVFKRGLLLYEAENLPFAYSVAREINGHLWGSGYQAPAAVTASGWHAFAAEFNPGWLVQGENRLDLRNAGGGLQVRNLRVLLESDSGWNRVARISEPELYDNDVASGTDRSAGSTPLTVGFEQPLQPRLLELYLAEPVSAVLRLDYATAGGWRELTSGWRIDLAHLRPGWNQIPLPVAVDTDGLRLELEGGGTARITELRVCTSPAAAGSAPARLVVTAPVAGEYFGHSAMVEGFVVPAGTETDLAVSVEGHVAAVSAADGSFRIALNRGATRYALQDDATPWAAQVTATLTPRAGAEKLRHVLGKGETLSQSVAFNRNLLPAEASDSTDTAAQGVEAAAAEKTAAEPFRETVNPGQAKKIVFRDVTLDIPEGAVDSATEITIIPLSEADLPPLDAGMVNVTWPVAGYRFLPHGTKFKKAVRLSFGYSRNVLLAGQSDDDVRMYYYHERARNWQQLTKVKVDPQTSQVISETDHFTDIINATLVVPEHPEALTYNPNTIKEIKAADPGTGINLIEPPQANNQGDARLSYPIEVPPGRKGLQPQLAIAYSSGGGNGWLGLGWDLSTPAVTVDTRWGVPRYGENLGDEDKGKGPLETETYLLDGEMLTPVAHRGAFVPRTPGDKLFFPRVEGQFRRIVRHGDAPNDFWWEVTDKNGTHFYYGGRPDASGKKKLDPEAVLADAQSGNIFRWGLAEVRDVHGNSISYSYEQIEDTGLELGQVAGRQLYLRSINYTGFQGSAGAFTVTFLRDRDLPGFQRRTDVIIDCRPGFKTVTADLLKEIKIAYNDQPVRSYQLFYQSGAFGKTLLEAVAQFDAEGHEFNRHRFGYFDQLRRTDGNYNGFADDKSWSPPNDKVLPPIPGGMPPGFPSVVPNKLDATALSGSNGYNIGGHLFVGVGIYSKDKSFSIGGKVGYSQAQNEGILALIDIDGDGLSDKVFRDENGTVCYRRGALQSDGSLTFGDKRSIAGLPTISKDKSKTLTYGLEGFIYVVSFHDDISESLSRGTAYFSDVNGDGLVDLVNRGNVLFNHLENGAPVFTNTSGETEVPLGDGLLSSSGLLDDDEMQRREEEARKTFPLVDAVRVWSAPYDGTVRIGGTVELLSAPASEEPLDGVKVAVQHGSQQLWSQSLAFGSSAVTPTNAAGGALQTVVKRGERIYFRVQSVDNGSFDRVVWAPQITYLGVDATQRDVNGLTVYDYQAERDFVLFGRRSDVLMPYKGQVRLTGSFQKRGTTSDDVRLVVAKNGIPLITRLVPAAQADVTLDFDEAIEIGVDANLIPSQLDLPLTAEEKQQAADRMNVPLEQLDRLEFRIEADSPVDLSRLSWAPQLFYTAVDGPDEILDEEGNYQIRIVPPVDADLYPDSALIAPQTAWQAPKAGDLLVVPRLVFDFPVASAVNSELVLTVKRQENGGELLAKEAIPIRDGVLPAAVDLAIVAPGVKEGDRLFFDLSTRDPNLARYLTGSTLELGFFTPLPQTQPLAGVAAVQPHFPPFNSESSGRLLLAAMVDGRMVARNIYQIENGQLADPDTSLSFEVQAGSTVSFAQVSDPTELRAENLALAVVPVTSWVAPATGSVTVAPSVSGTPVADGTLQFEVLRGVELLASRTLTVNGGSSPALSVPVTAAVSDTLTFRFSTNDTALVDDLTGLGATVAYADETVAAPVELTLDGVPIAAPATETETVAVLHSARVPDLLPTPFRGWSYLAYNGNGAWGEAPIDEAVLKLDTDKYLKVAKRQSEFHLSEERVWPLIGQSELARWGGFDEDFALTASGASSSRFGLNDVSLPRSAQVAGTRAVDRISEGETNAIGAGIILSGSKSSGDKSGNLLDFFDLNGDRFPDIVSRSNTQYTHPTGALYDVEPNGVMRSATNGSWNVGISGNPVRGIPSPRALFNASKSGGNHGSSEPSLSLSAGFGGGDSTVDCDYLDLNGDGLPDRVYRNGEVRWNLGYKYAEFAETYKQTTIDESRTTNASFGGGYNSKGIYMLGGGVNLGYSVTRNEKLLLDLNGDGLPDRLEPAGEAINVAFNSGSGFLPPVKWYGAIEKKNELAGLGGSSSLTQSNNASLGGGAYVSFYLRYQVAYVQIVITINPGINGGISTSRQELAVRDVNGDGYPDHVRSENNTDLDVALSNIGTTNLLQSVERPLGGRFELAYERSGNTQDQPQSKWVLSRVTVDDGIAGDGPLQQVAFRYADGKYSRLEREFYGYRTVVEERGEPGTAAFRVTERTYATDSWYAKGLLRRETLRDEAGRIYSIAARGYALVDPADGRPGDDLSLVARLFPRLASEATGRYEGLLLSDTVALPATFSSSAAVAADMLPNQVGKIGSSGYTYDDYGNVVTFTESGEPGPADDVTASIEYDYQSQPWLMSLPRLIVVRGGDGKLYRRREGVFNGFGDLTEHRAQIRNGRLAQTNIDYDSYGNVSRVEGPANDKDQRYALDYLYDDAVHTYVQQITDSFGYVSSATYDPRFGVPLRTVDLNNNVVAYLPDAAGRTREIRGPYDQGAAVATIAFEYHPEAHPAWARTFNKEEWEANDTLDTLLYIDGLKRVLQTKKEAEVLQGEQKVYGLTVSGKVEFDALGRSLEQGQPLFEAGYHTAFTALGAAKNPTRFSYDLLDRTLTTTLPDDAVTAMSYGFEDGMFVTVVTDAEGKVKKTLKDVRGNIVAVKEKLDAQWVVTRYAYDPLTQIVRVTDDRNNLTTVDYDQLGRRTAIANPDTGLVEYRFDDAGNLTGKVTPNLRGNGKQIGYQYDYTRLAQVDYPASGSFIYGYGAPGAEHNRAGRIVTVNSPDYRDERFYGKLGETVKTIKSIRSDVPSRVWPLYTTEYRFDSFGRMQRMVYPDGEVLSYGYDQGGLLESAAGVKGGKRYEYLLDLAYDEFGQRVRLQLGNKVATRYSYDPLTRRLDHILTLGADGSVLQNQDYSFDRVGNVTRTENRGFVTREERSRSVVQNFRYDDLHRLVHADGTYSGATDHLDRYDGSFAYDTIGNFRSKVQRHWYADLTTGSQAERPHTTFDYSYSFTGPQPHALTHVGGDSYRYDDNGNLIERIDDQTKQLRQLVWDEENRLSRSYDQGKETIYRYDDAGSRIVKRGKYGEISYVDPTFSIREAVVASKHIFAGNTRIATKLVMMENRTGTGKITYDRPDGTHGHSGTVPEKSRGAHNGPDKQLDPQLQQQANEHAWQQRERRSAAAHGKGHDKVRNNSAATGLPGRSENGLENALRNGDGNKYGIYRRLDRLGYEITVDHRIVPQGSSEPSDPLDPIFAGPTVPEEHQIYYYHGDHLGSSTVISDRFGRNYEHLQYFPYGETWVEEARNQTNLPYKFTGKELDPETGLYYFGARYYDARVGVWVSVDPMLEKYLPEAKKTESNFYGIYESKNISLFSYAHSNPIIKLDPDGRLTIIVHGTFANKENWPNPGQPFNDAVSSTFREHAVAFKWSGSNNVQERSKGAMALALFVQNNIKPGEKLNIVAHSHGGNIVKEYTNLNNAITIDNLVTLGTPQRDDYKINKNKVRNYVNAYSNNDLIQTKGGYSGKLEVGSAGRVDSMADSNINAASGALLNKQGPIDTRRINYDADYGHGDLHTPSAWKQIEGSVK